MQDAAQRSATNRDEHLTPAGSLNANCWCIGTDSPGLDAEIEALLRANGIGDRLTDSHPHLFASVPVFIDGEQAAQIARTVAAIHSVTSLPAWPAHCLSGAPAVAQPVPGNRGAFLGVDFHLGTPSPQVIEINTNPGGALLNVLLGRAQQACCAEVADTFIRDDYDAIEAAILDAFLSEWRTGSGTGEAPQRLAIVDAAPAQQFLYPEFLLYQRLFRRHGIDAVIVDPEALQVDAHGLHAAGQRIDMVYNRLTDFTLQSAAAAALRTAWLRGHIVMTPHPHAHALFANKRNLVALSDPEQLIALGADTATRAALAASIPATTLVTAANAEALWTQRKHLFFKPLDGFGSRGTYRGDKLTQRVFATIMAGNYVAQGLVQPSERVVAASGAPTLKVDVRAYAYNGSVLLLAARLYRGQTTNFRSDGGGFATVLRAERACGSRC